KRPIPSSHLSPGNIVTNTMVQSFCANLFSSWQARKESKIEKTMLKYLLEEENGKRPTRYIYHLALRKETISKQSILLIDDDFIIDKVLCSLVYSFFLL